MSINDGYRAKNSELSKSGIPFARAQNINNGFHFEDADRFPSDALAKIGNKISAPGDVVFTSKGTVGRFALVRPDTPRFVYAPQLCFWRSLDHEQIEPRWLYYWMHSREFFVQYKGVAGQTDMAEYVSLGDQRRMHITVPPPAEQHAIAAVLGALDDKIEVNRKQARVLEGIARAVFNSWFVDFDPVRRKAAGEPTGLPDDIAALFPDRLVDSPMGEVPEGWRDGTLGDVAEFNARTLSRSDPLDAEYLDYIEISQVMRGNIGQIVRYAIGSEPSRAKRRLTHGDTVMSTVRPDRGAYFLCLNPTETLIASTGFAVMTATEGDWAFLYIAATAPGVITELGRLADGGAYPAVRPEVIAGLPLVLPPDVSPRRAFHTFASPLLERAHIGRMQTASLAALRDALLPKLISGELRIADAEQIAGRAV
ncbi:MAG: restriction endonuclease subunit S [Phycisphaerales bacterium]|nr:restriction endonuclease subunit S [Phycisphaerales bacterium]